MFFLRKKYSFSFKSITYQWERYKLPILSTLKNCLHDSDKHTHRNIYLSPFSIFDFRAWGICWTGVTTRVKFYLISMFIKIEGPCIPQQCENSGGNEFSFDLMLWIRLISFRFLHDSNPRMNTDFVSITKDTSNTSFLCSRVSEHLPITGISE